MSELPEGSVWQEDGEWVVDPEIVAPRLGFSPAEFQAAMRAGRVVGTVERGEGEDAGRTRLTFRHGQQAWSVQIEPDGTATETTPPTQRDAPSPWIKGH